MWHAVPAAAAVAVGRTVKAQGKFTKVKSEGREGAGEKRRGEARQDAVAACGVDRSPRVWAGELN